MNHMEGMKATGGRGIAKDIMDMCVFMGGDVCVLQLCVYVWVGVCYSCVFMGGVCACATAAYEHESGTPVQ